MNVRLAALVFGFFSLVSGCSQPTGQARDVGRAGFLRDYSVLRQGGKGQPLLVYENPAADLSQYKRAFVEPVTIFRSGSAKKDPISEHELKQLAFELRTELRVVLRRFYEVVDESSPDAVRIRAALVDPREAKVGMKIWTATVPLLGRLYSGAEKITTGTNNFVGAASVEFEMIDPGSDQVLFAAVDRRSGKRSLRGAADSWDDVRLIFKQWGEQLDRGLRRRIQ